MFETAALKQIRGPQEHFRAVAQGLKRPPGRSVQRQWLHPLSSQALELTAYRRQIQHRIGSEVAPAKA